MTVRMLIVCRFNIKDGINNTVLVNENLSIKLNTVLLDTTAFVSNSYRTVLLDTGLYQIYIV